MKRMPIGDFVIGLQEAYQRGDGYIMASHGENPRTGYLDLKKTECKASWKPSGWFYTQYSGRQRDQALIWRSKCVRVWDCNGMAEGLYELYTGNDINTQARYNYANWCSPKGGGMIPPERRVPGAAVFWGNSASSIHHVAYLEKPVDANNPGGDWYLIEARGVMYGVVKTRLHTRNPNYWGWMTKYFDYEQTAELPSETNPVQLGERTLKFGDVGDDVNALQQALIKAGFKLPKYGADGEFGAETQSALMAYQAQHGLTPDGIAGKATLGVLLGTVEVTDKYLKVTGGSVYVRAGASTSYKILGVVYRGDLLKYCNEEKNGFRRIVYNQTTGWISAKYTEVTHV